jgi:asparagine synthase (glutamine-hydrolysing)
VDFSARLAPNQKLRGTRLRYFFKEALRDFLPAAIITKEKHGFGLPFGPWMASHASLNALARDNLTDLKSRGIVRPDFIDELTGKHLAEHAGYYGAMIWVLIMLELWFKQHGASA